MSRTFKELTDAYNQLCANIGDRTNKIRLLEKEVTQLQSQVDALDGEYQELQKKNAEDAKKRQEQEAAESAEKMAKAEAKRERKGLKAVPDEEDAGGVTADTAAPSDTPEQQS